MGFNSGFKGLTYLPGSPVKEFSLEALRTEPLAAEVK